jgi:hypothetical protein
LDPQLSLREVEEIEIVRLRRMNWPHHACSFARVKNAFVRPQPGNFVCALEKLVCTEFPVLCTITMIFAQKWNQFSHRTPNHATETALQARFFGV